MIVHHCKADVMTATRHLELAYCEQPQLNGTGGAILAAQKWIEAQTCDRLIITMGDVPYVRPDTYTGLVGQLDDHDMVILSFEPADKKQYGVL